MEVVEEEAGLTASAGAVGKLQLGDAGLEALASGLACRLRQLRGARSGRQLPVSSSAAQNEEEKNSGRGGDRRR